MGWEGGGWWSDMVWDERVVGVVDLDLATGVVWWSCGGEVWVRLDVEKRFTGG